MLGFIYINEMKLNLNIHLVQKIHAIKTGVVGASLVEDTGFGVSMVKFT